MSKTIREFQQYGEVEIATAPLKKTVITSYQNLSAFVTISQRFKWRKCSQLPWHYVRATTKNFFTHYDVTQREWEWFDFGLFKFARKTI